MLAYAAGLFEGEGCISIGRSRLRSGMWQHWLTCSVQMGDPEPLEFLQSEWNGGIYRMAVKGNRRPQQTWRVNTRVAAAFLKDVAPYFLTARVARKAELALAFQAQKMNTGCRPSPEYLAAQESFYVEMRRLNQRGLDAIPTEPRIAGARHMEGAVI